MDHRTRRTMAKDPKTKHLKARADDLLDRAHAWLVATNQTKWWRIAELALVATASFLYFHWYQFSSTHLCGTDPYYHIKFAEWTRLHGVVRDFPWARFSQWHEHFFDKEFIYHLYLSLFTYGDLIRGAKWAVVGTGTATFTAYFAILRAHRIRYPWLWWGLLVSAGGYLLFRINVTRPQTMSVLLLLIGLHVLLSERLWLIGILSLIYSLSYTGHYQYVGLALVYGFICRYKDGKWNMAPFYWALGGMLLGWLVHPNFPNNVYGFFMQNVLVIWNQLHGTVDLHMGGELNPMSTRSLLNVNTATLISLWSVVTVAIFHPLETDRKTLFLFAASTIYLVLTLITKRFAEYWIPVTILFAAFYFDAAPKAWTLGGMLEDRRRILFWLSVLVLAGGIPFMWYQSHKDTFRQLNSCGPSTYDRSAAWVAKNIPEGEFLLTCDWDDAPYLFFASTKHRYTVFMDPTFFYNWNPKLWHVWDDLAHGKDSHPAETIRRVFHARYLYCTSDYGGLRRQLQRAPGARLIYPVPDRSLQPEPCATNEDCPQAMICDNPACKPGKVCHIKKGRCKTDPHVFIFRIDDPTSAGVGSSVRTRP